MTAIPTTTPRAVSSAPVGKLESLGPFVPGLVAVLDDELVIVGSAAAPRSPVIVGARAAGGWTWTHRETFADEVRLAVSAERVALAFRRPDINRLACHNFLQVRDVDGKLVWAWEYQTHSSCEQGVEALAIDAAQNVYVAFEHGGRAKLEAITPKSQKVLVSFSPAGKPRWHRSLPTPTTVASMAVRGTTLALAATAGPDAEPDFGHGKRALRGFAYSAGLVAVYDTDGKPEWDGTIAQGMTSFGEVGGIGIMQDGSIVAAVGVAGVSRRGWVLRVRGASGQALPPMWERELPPDALPSGLAVGDDDRVVTVGALRDPDKVAAGTAKPWHQPDRGFIMDLSAAGDVRTTWIRKGFLPSNVSAGADGDLFVAGLDIRDLSGALLVLPR